MIKRGVWLIISACFTLAGCAGGGKEAPAASVAPAPLSPAPTDPTIYKSISAGMKAGKLVYEGPSVEFNYTRNGRQTTVGPDQNGIATITMNYGVDGVGTSSSLGAQLASSFSWNSGSEIYPLMSLDKPNSDKSSLIFSADGKAAIIIVNPNSKAHSFDYQVFGVWETGINASSGSMGAATFGSETNAAFVPTIGTASFIGTALGGSKDTVGNHYDTQADASLAVDFGDIIVALATSQGRVVGAVGKRGRGRIADTGDLVDNAVVVVRAHNFSPHQA